MNTANTPLRSGRQENPKRPMPERQRSGANPETMEQITEYMKYGGSAVFGANTKDILEALASEANMTTLKSLDRGYQQRLFLTMAHDNPRATLENYFLFIDRPYGMQVMEQAALDDPDTAMEMVRKFPEDPKFKKLQHFISTKVGTEHSQQLEAEEEMGFFRWLTIKLFGADNMGVTTPPSRPAKISTPPTELKKEVSEKPAEEKKEAIVEKVEKKPEVKEEETEKEKTAEKEDKRKKEDEKEEVKKTEEKKDESKG